MKNLSLAAIFVLSFSILFAQKDTVYPAPYLQIPEVPPFKLLKPDSVSYFSKADLIKNKPVLIMIFNPDCDHCQHETEDILAQIDKFEKIQIVMSTNAPLSQLKEFYKKYQLNKYSNVTAGMEIKYFLPTFFALRNLPYLAMYDKKGKLLTSFEGTMKVEKILEAFK